MTDRSTGGFAPDEFRDLEERLRIAMAQEVRQVSPHDRLGNIRAELDSRQKGQRGRPRWLAPVGAAAAVAVLATVGWLGLRPDSAATPVSTPSTTTQVTTPTGSPTTTAPTSRPTSSPPVVPPPPPPSPPPTGGPTTPPPPEATVPGTVPVYFVGPLSGRWVLHREFLPAALPPNADAAARVKAAVVLAVAAQPYAKSDGYLPTFPAGTTVGKVAVTDNGIGVELTNAGTSGLSTAQQQAAVEGLVYTATAAASKTVPVIFSIAGGGTQLFSTIPTNTAYSRVPADQELGLLAPIWVDNPSRGEAFRAGQQVSVQGQACVFEAAMSWELRQSANVVNKGFTSAQSGCPTRGAYSIPLGALSAGDYAIRVFALSPKDGSVAAEKTVRFTVK